jgi:phage-related protein
MNVFDLVAKISLDSSEYDKGLDDASDKANGMGSKISKGVGVASKAVVAGVGVAATAVGGLVASATKGYGEYEQLTGGIETLYKDASDQMLAYADNAYKTAGLSANEYMQTAIDSSAAMINSLGGDTQKAAEMTDMAITDMADNMNKMGTNMESLQNAYKGFSRGNFTMLDNLSLGYAGTKEGMEQLLADAEKISGIKYDISSYSDMVAAIHVVQTEMGITGTTAEEASGTIQGSVGSVSAAWQNLVAGLGDSNADLDTLIGNFIDSLMTAGENLLPVIEQALEGVAKLIEKLAPIIAEKIPELVPKLLPPLISAATKIVAGLIQALPTIIGVLIQQIPVILSELGSAILSVAPQILGAVIQIGVMILAEAGKLLGQLLEVIFVGIGNILSGVIEFIVAWASVFAEIFSALWDGFKEILQSFGEFFVMIWEGIQSAFSNVISFFTEIFQGAWDGIQNIWSAVTGFFSGIWSGITGIFSGVASWFSGIFSSAFNAVTSIWSAITGFFSGVWNTIVGIFKDAGVAVGDAISGAVKGAVNAVLKGATGIINGFISAINLAISVINAIPGVKISKLEKLSAPALEEGIGLAQKGKQYLLEGKGNEAVVPIDKDLKWTNKVAGDMLMALSRQGLALGGQSGDIIIPVYIGNDRIQEIVVKANKINDYRSGGVA